METIDKNKGGRPRTGRNIPVTVKLSDEALTLLKGERNKSAFIDRLIRGEVAQVKCPCCGEVFLIRKEE